MLDSPYFAPVALATAVIALLAIQGGSWLRDRWIIPRWLMGTLPDDAEPDERLPIQEDS